MTNFINKNNGGSKQLSVLLVIFLYATSIVDVLRILSGSVITVSDSFISWFRNLLYIFVFVLLLLCLFKNKNGLFDFLVTSLVYLALLLFSILINPLIKLIALNSLLMVFSRIIPAFLLGKYCDISSFLKYLHKSSLFLLLYTIVFVVFGVNSSRYYYMNVGYNILFPSLILLFYKKNWIDVAISLFSLVVNLLYCARGSIIVAIVAIAFFFAISILKKKNGILFLPVGCVLAGLIIYLAPSIIDQLYEMMPSSRTLRYLISNRLFDSSGRDVFYSSAFSVLSENPFIIRGLLGDRLFYADVLQLSLLSDIEGAFAHNVFIELSLQFGVIVGAIALIFTIFSVINPLYIIIKTKQAHYKDITVIYCALIIPCLAIAMTTSSYLSNFEMCLMLGLCINLFKYGKNSSFVCQNKRSRFTTSPIFQ